MIIKKISEYAETCNYTPGGDYKDRASDLSYHLGYVCPDELIKDMPCGYNCPRSFLKWFGEQP